MARKRAAVFGCLLLTGVLSTTTLSPANASVSKETVSVQTTKCRQWVINGKKWLAMIKKPTKSNNWRTVRKRIVVERVHWKGSARAQAEIIIQRLNYYCR
jgi:hypothetical protein